jgi:hypothetical protein
MSERGEAQMDAQAAVRRGQAAMDEQLARAFTPGQVRAIAFLHDHGRRWVPYWFAGRLVTDTCLLMAELGPIAARRFLTRMGLPVTEAYTVICLLNADPTRRTL